MHPDKNSLQIIKSTNLYLCSWTARQCHSICPGHNQYNGPAWTAQCWGGRYQSGKGPGILCPPDSSALQYSGPHMTDQWGSAQWIPAGSSDWPNIYQQVMSDLHTCIWPNKKVVIGLSIKNLLRLYFFSLHDWGDKSEWKLKIICFLYHYWSWIFIP